MGRRLSRFRTWLGAGTSSCWTCGDSREDLILKQLRSILQSLTCSINDYAFDIKRCTSFEGDFGPFIQYTHVRLASIQRKNPNAVLAESISEIDLSILNDPKVHDIVYHLAMYPFAVQNAYKQSEPSQLVTWCFKISHLVGSAWETVKIKGAEPEEQKARLFLYVMTREVLASAMRLLSLTPIERM